MTVELSGQETDAALQGIVIHTRNSSVDSAFDEPGRKIDKSSAN